MKREIHILFFLCISFLFGGCNQEDFGDTDGAGITGDSRVPVKIDAERDISTRIQNDGTNWELTDTIGIFMYDSQKTLSWESIVEDAHNIPYHFIRRYSSFEQTFTLREDTLFFPEKREQKVSFRGYYPYQSPITDFTLPINTITQYETSELDILYTRVLTGEVLRRDSVRIMFHHMMSKLQVVLVPGEGVLTVDDATIKLTDVYRTANFDLVDGTMKDIGSRGEIQLSRPSEKLIYHRAFLIPQLRGTETKLIIKLNNNQDEFEYTFPNNMEFRMGQYYLYSITVNKTGIEVTENIITDWEDKDDGPIVDIAHP